MKIKRGKNNKIICNPKEHFESKFRITPGCWIWTAGCYNTGYGQFYDGKKGYRAHRFSYELYVGKIGDLMVCHKCDNKLCVNPDHLWLGTHLQNMEDRGKKGRTAKNYGTDQGTSKLTDDQVIKIRSMNGLQKNIAKIFNVDPSLISYIKSGKIWPHLL